MTLISLKERTEPTEYYEGAQIYPFTRWSPDIVNWIRVGEERVTEEEEPSLFREPGYCSFEVRMLHLPLATDRWVVRWPGHPELTFEDLRAGQLPSLSPDELAERREEIRAAREIREKLNISPLTTSAIIRQLRQGTEKE